MLEKILVTIAPERGRVRILARAGAQDLLKAVLGPAESTHPRAAATLLEGLSLWHQQALSVVLVAGDSSDGSALRLCDGLGFGQRSVHFEVGIAIRDSHARRRRTLSGLGDFRDLRQLTFWEADR
ncbi:MAG: hypothetical protein R3F14_16140 [Polyangiaceae bacterium]